MGREALTICTTLRYEYTTHYTSTVLYYTALKSKHADEHFLDNDIITFFFSMYLLIFYL